MFNDDYNLTWNNLSVALGFAPTCNIYLENATNEFDKLEFWHDNIERKECSKPRTNHIHNPTLHFMHHWIGITLFACDDVRIVKNDDLRVMYAMVHKIHISPMKAMVAHWSSVLARKGSIEFTALISRIANSMRMLINKPVQYITTPRSLLNFEYFK